MSDVTDGWGPGRDVYTENNRPRSAVLNSVTDNPGHGDERNLLAVKEVATGRWHTEGDVGMKPGQTYEASIFFRNDAVPGTGTGASTGTRVRAQLPATVEGRARITGLLQSDNAVVPLMWRSLVLTAPAGQPVAIRIVSDSSEMFTKAAAAGLPLPAEELFSEAGALVGCSAADGVVTGDEDCQGDVRFRFVADQPNFVVSQAVAATGPDGHHSGPLFPAGTRVTYKIHYRNTGTTRQNNVVLEEELPEGFRYVRGSTSYSTSTTGGKWRKGADGVTEGGIDVGSYAPGGGAYVEFAVLLPDRGQLDCGLTGATSEALARTRNGTKGASSVVIVEKKCA